MTRDEAVAQFMNALDRALFESALVTVARNNLERMGLRVDSIQISIELQVMPAEEAPPADVDFLRKLRITPDLEVRD